MKRLLLLFITGFVILPAFAQENPKSYFVTTSVGAAAQEDSRGDKFNSYQISAAISKLEAEKWAIGIFAEYGRGVSKTESTREDNAFNMRYHDYFRQEINSWFFGSQARYYYPLKQKLSVFGELRAGIKYEASDSEYYSASFSNSDPNSTSQFGGTYQSSGLALKAVVAPGILYFLKPRLGIEGKLSILHYNHVLDDSASPEGATYSHDFSTDFGLSSVRVGASFYF